MIRMCQGRMAARVPQSNSLPDASGLSFFRTLIDAFCQSATLPGAGSVFVLVALYALYPAFASQEPTIGFVLEIRGRWTVAGQPVARGQAITASSRITIVSEPAGNGVASSCITIVLLNNRSLGCGCGQSRPCDSGVIEVPRRITSSSTVTARIIEAALRLFSRQPERYVPALSRSGSARDFDGVVKLAGSQIHFAEPLPCDAGIPYSLLLRQVDSTPGAGVVARSSAPFFCVQSLHAAEFPESLRPGLYRARLAPTSFDAGPAFESWILVAAGRDYDAYEGEFVRMTDSTLAWASNVSPATFRGFKRACLAQLAASRE
jgi:hypothetical protein